jgi:hypothetical protein
MTMTLSTLFCVVLQAVGRDPGAAGLAPDEARTSSAPARPTTTREAARGGAASSPITSLFELSLPQRGQAR